jgi:hypothetical protein
MQLADTNVIYVAYKFQIVQLRKLLIYKNIDHQQIHKDSFIINRNGLLHVSTLLGHLQGELFVTVTLGLHFTVE